MGPDSTSGRSSTIPESHTPPSPGNPAWTGDQDGAPTGVITLSIGGIPGTSTMERSGCNTGPPTMGAPGRWGAVTGVGAGHRSVPMMITGCCCSPRAACETKTIATTAACETTAASIPDVGERGAGCDPG